MLQKRIGDLRESVIGAENVARRERGVDPDLQPVVFLPDELRICLPGINVIILFPDLVIDLAVRADAEAALPVDLINAVVRGLLRIGLIPVDRDAGF